MTTIVQAAPPLSVSRDQGLSSLAHLAASASPMVTTHPRSTPPGRSGPASAEQSPRSAPRSVMDETMSPKRPSGPPSIKVKKEPASPNPSSSRPRPRRLDLSGKTSSRGPQSARPSAPLTAKDSAGLAIHDLGVACLSPGFQTHDPAMREQLQRSLDVREQQRLIIEARQKGSSRPAPSHDSAEPAQRTADAQFEIPQQAPSLSRRKGPPPGLSINAPSASSFANERVIQSAPLHHSFTGLRPHPFSQQPSNLGQSSHIHHVPATQTANRLPPISDVFANDTLAGPPSSLRSAIFPGQSPNHHQQPLQSPGFAPPQQSQPPPSSRGREFKSAEEAVQEMSRGRDELLPKIVHYGGVQPPTPPSPMPNRGQPQQHPQHPSHTQSYPPPQHHQQQQQQQPQQQQSGPLHHLDTSRQDYSQASTGQRRTRDEYERENGSPVRQRENKRTSFIARDEGGADWRAGMGSQEKREEFLRLCARAWDLFHS
ncbi:hypothetical protein MBLNU459_g1694t1 [Dothideomycetes sp. NU459]